MLSLYAICSFLVVGFPVGQPGTTATLHGDIHDLSALIGFLSIAIAALVWSRCFRKGTLWRSSGLASLILGLLMLLLLFGFLLVPSSLQGLAERVLEVLVILWLCFESWRLSRLAES